MSRRGGRGSSRRRRGSADFLDDFVKYHGNEKSESYLGYGNGGDTDKWFRSLTDEEAKAIRRYSGSNYDDINEAIRKNKNNSFMEVAKEIEKALDKSELTKSIVVHRGDGGSVFGGDDFKNKSGKERYGILKEKIGSIFSFDNFVSASPTKPWGGRTQYHITVPKGKGWGAYIKDVSLHPSENEFLINAHKKLKINGVKLNNNGYTVDLYLTLVN